MVRGIVNLYERAQGAPVRAPRPVPPLLLLPRLRARATATTRRRASVSSSSRPRLRRDGDRVAGDAVRVRARAAAHAGAHAAGCGPRRRRGRARAQDHGDGPHLAGPAQGHPCSTPTARPEALRSDRTWGEAFPAAYQEDTPFEVAVDDIGALERVVAEPADLHIALYRRKDQPSHNGAVQAPARGPPDPDLGRPADHREPRPEADQRTPLRSRQRTGRRLDPGFRARAPARRQHRPCDRRTAPQGDICPRLDGRGGQRRLQPPGARRRSRLARGCGASHLCALVRPARPAALAGLYRGGAREQRGGRRTPR